MVIKKEFCIRFVTDIILKSQLRGGKKRKQKQTNEKAATSVAGETCIYF